MYDTDWTVIETAESTFNSTQLHHKETVFTLGNGYLGTRGAFEEGYPGACPATLINGIYDDAPLVTTELANCPDWLALVIMIGGDRFRLDQGDVLSYQRSLDLRRGILNRWVRWRSPAGHIIELTFERFVSLADQHVLALRCQITSVNYAGAIEIHTSLNGYPDNQGLMHWESLNQMGRGYAIGLHVRSRHSKHEVGMAAQLSVVGVEQLETRAIAFQGFPTLVTQFEMQVGQSVTLEKLVTVFTSRDNRVPFDAALDKLNHLPGYAILLASHITAWAKVWEINDVVIEGDPTAQLAIRYNLFQLLSAAPRHDDRVSIPAKTLSGFAYRGHIFWDTEIFLLPCLNLTQPALARNLLTYRYHSLPGARRKAQTQGYEGAMYAWESAETGDEVTPTWVPGPDGKGLVRIWCGDIELHINTDIAYAIWHYWHVTGDDAWMRMYGAEIILDTAVFWGSRAEWNPSHQRFEIRNVIGPDEYHEQVDNNAFTNRMVQWHLQIAFETLEWLRQVDPAHAATLEQQLDLTGDRLQHWRDMIRHLWVPTDLVTGLIEQFEGFFAREDIDLAEYEPRTRSMQAILGIEGAKERQVLKQADVIMLLYMLRDGVFGDGAVHYDRQILQTNWDYYVPRTDHTYGSSLGPPVHAILACEMGKPDEAYEHFMRSVLVDLADVRGNAAEGIHAASTGGVWQAVVFGFGGVRLTKSGPVATPHLPTHWTRLHFKLIWQGQPYEFDLRPARVPFTVPNTQPGRLPIQGVIFDLDGVLTDTSEFHYLGWKRLADEENLPFDRTANEALRGVSRRDSLLRLLNGRSVSEDELQEMMTRKNQYYLELIRTITPDHLLPGVNQLLTELNAVGIRVALGSASKNAREVIERLGIAHHIQAIADGYSVAKSKPAPDVFLYAAQQLDLAPGHCIVVEDAASGIEAALSAGMWAIGLGPNERVGKAHLVLPNLTDVHWEMLLQQLSDAVRRTAIELSLQQLVQNRR
ncbi:beta-phosphoglucomutase [Oscillatoria sp. FACHB-1407]|uniref:beta-phosphoglucomutase n=1 Tax=Oscillatoria sp. FACHB-1407 TaxID=2692847 RepID=UPI0016870F98|nr:beta-phosphoglucomutase [Oscillatoria sp. FACHB-1407]MBD2461377.1 beta-phosphoglucomutase [Oscillatoria sp. FACHB-1407]